VCFLHKFILLKKGADLYGQFVSVAERELAALLYCGLFGYLYVLVSLFLCSFIVCFTYPLPDSGEQSCVLMCLFAFCTDLLFDNHLLFRINLFSVYFNTNFNNACNMLLYSNYFTVERAEKVLCCSSSRCHTCVFVCPPTACHVSLGSEGNVLYPVLSSLYYVVANLVATVSLTNSLNTQCPWQLSMRFKSLI